MKEDNKDVGDESSTTFRQESISLEKLELSKKITPLHNKSKETFSTPKPNPPNKAKTKDHAIPQKDKLSLPPKLNETQSQSTNLEDKHHDIEHIPEMVKKVKRLPKLTIFTKGILLSIEIC